MRNEGVDGAVAPARWVRSSYSNGAGGECVECAYAGDRVLLRDTKVGDALVTGVGASAWGVFVRAVRGDGLRETSPSR
ncbi:DUF397 domain-containing protein [Streptomyces griseoviridis]|uniref:DUF397 domain-containing protein n=2 Tax=Streptomyces TaxID=1883 RepID=A0A918G2X6_STRGD|nr:MULTISPECIES: DUF397 domain-containing protein [Streptomyces]GGS16721.1 hypothetical protein GCM10010238_00690 [Streptomyces niveoruber]GGU35148.1 hypothetical protein GCM10010259_27070 [Streptomyces daghestanicus]GHI33974.1 hypothetical protein Sdagh_57040 [Streptomyces daghestanicus]